MLWCTKKIKVYVDDMIVKFKKRKSCLGFKKVVWDIKEVQVEAQPCKIFIWSKIWKVIKIRDK